MSKLTNKQFKALSNILDGNILMSKDETKFGLKAMLTYETSGVTVNPDDEIMVNEVENGFEVWFAIPCDPFNRDMWTSHFPDKKGLKDALEEFNEIKNNLNSF